MAARMAAGSDPKRLAVRHALHFDRWRVWAGLAGTRLARRFAVDVEEMIEALDRELDEHFGQLERELSA